jgi:ATP-dependent Clp protease protease subunit
MNEILASHTGRDVEQIAEDTERDYYMSAEEAQVYGIVDAVVSERVAEKSDEDGKG